ncbi:MAG: hypothetical protein IKK33_10535 [Lachnospiraceae bacterium]|nr:hypothetical protein [Lachnospiraceae bacterium]
MIVLAWILLIGAPILLGLGVMTIIDWRSERRFIGFADCFVCGFLGCIGITQIAHCLGLFGKVSLKMTGKIWLVLLVSFTLLMAVVGLSRIWKNKFQNKEILQRSVVEKGLPIIVLGMFFLQSLYVFCRNPITIPGDIIPETVQSFLAQDGIYQVMPLTGDQSELGMPLRYTILCLPTLYAVIADIFKADARLVIYHLVPVVVLGASYLTYFRLGESLFGKSRLKECYIFLLAVGILFLFSDQAVFLDGYGALHAGYMGTSIRNLVLVPYVISAMLDRKYWKAILCILAEACIAWTFYGFGVCIVITMGMLFLDILEHKVPWIGKMLQIFSDKEEQA